MQIGLSGLGKAPKIKSFDELINGPKNSKSRPKCPPHLKPAIRNRWWSQSTLDGTCFCCGRNLHYDDADVGHIKAYSKGGNWVPDNCRLICRTCNSGMRNINMKVYMKKTYPERYKQYFPKEENTKTKINTPKKKRKFQSNNIF